jgi:signal transduction histidine kinase
MNMFAGFTIREKLTSISVLSCATALTTASIAFLVLDRHTFRRSMERRILSEAQIISFNSISPLLFRDAEAAAATLGGLRAEPAVSTATIFAEESARPFATYARDGASVATFAAAASPPVAGHVFTAGHLVVTEPVLFEGKTIGVLVIQADLSELRVRQRRYAGIALLVLVGSFVVAIALSRTVEKAILKPILHLAHTARAVSSGKDYSVRAMEQGPDEIGQLVVTFNQMLDQIEAQNSQLEEARGDLERRVEARTQDLAAANRELEAFSYSVSHDLRAPLRAIDGFSRILLASHSEQLDDRGRHYLDRVRAGTMRMSQLIDDLLGLARVSRREMLRRPVNVTEVARRVASDLASRPPARDVPIHVAEGLVANADAHLLTIIFENLLGNAWKFTAKKTDPRIEVGANLVGAELVFHVRDNGAGFDMAYADKLFGAFQRLHTDADFEGTGIGLVTVQRIVNRHGGRIWAEAAVGQGATFYFTLEGTR